MIIDSKTVMSDKELRREAKEFCKGLLNGRLPTDMCFMVSTALSGYLRAIGVDCEEVEGIFDGYHHWWVRLSDGRVIDATASQFAKDGGGFYENVYLQHSSMHREEV